MVNSVEVTSEKRTKKTPYSLWDCCLKMDFLDSVDSEVRAESLFGRFTPHPESKHSSVHLRFESRLMSSKHRHTFGSIN